MMHKHLGTLVRLTSAFLKVATPHPLPFTHWLYAFVWVSGITGPSVPTSVQTVYHIHTAWYVVVRLTITTVTLIMTTTTYVCLLLLLFISLVFSFSFLSLFFVWFSPLGSVTVMVSWRQGAQQRSLKVENITDGQFLGCSDTDSGTFWRWRR